MLLHYSIPLLITLTAQSNVGATPAKPFENAYVRVTRNGAPCAPASPSACGERVLVALGPIHFEQYGQSRRMERGEIAVFRWNESYTAPMTGDYVEVSIKPDHPRVPPRDPISPGKAELLYEGETFFVLEERLAPGDTRPRHSHSEHVVIVLNDTRLRLRRDDQPEAICIEVADDVRFSGPVTHIMETIGDKSLRNVIIELKP